MIKPIILLIAVAILLSGCTSSEVKKVDAAASQTAATSTPDVKTFKVAGVGETLTNDELKITLNSAEFMEAIPSQNEYLTAIAKADYTFAVVEVTIENVYSKPSAVSSLIQFKVVDSDGYKYDMSFAGYTALDLHLDGTLQPGDKVRGKLAFEVPKSSKDLQMVFNFGLTDTAQAKFTLGTPK
ncbi:MAG: DUF4352 domain-containing protein [Candidatus Micrarchaeota archaeon]